MPRRPTLEFWFEFASTYSYLAAMRIEALAAAPARRRNRRDRRRCATGGQRPAGIAVARGRAGG
jgi:2-hydroxychromene-2-carboxylate isomerase